MKNKENNNANKLPVLEDRYTTGGGTSLIGVNPPDYSLPAFNPPVPNRAWTAMRSGTDIDELSDEEKRELYIGKDDIL